MRRTAILVGAVMGLLVGTINILCGRDLLVVATRSAVVSLLAAIICLLALRAVARVIMRQARDQARNLRSDH